MSHEGDAMKVQVITLAAALVLTEIFVLMINEPL